jgi:triosephosphate isomerase
LKKICGLCRWFHLPLVQPRSLSRGVFKDEAMRRLFVAGNWKMNTTLASAQKLAGEVVVGVAGITELVDVAVCPPFPHLLSVSQSLANSRVMLGAQNAHFENAGAYTGEVSIDMLVDVGCRWVIIGHSERRQFFGETDSQINLKVLAAFQRNVDVIFCVGEALDDRNSGRTESVLSSQLKLGLANVRIEQLEKLVIAYEPVWAIGTGVTASPEQAEGTHRFIRDWLAARFDRVSADAIRIQYGGSVKPDNAKQLLSLPNVDGALVGGASLMSNQFLGIIHAAADLARLSGE